jgi:hypothetical protein
MNLLDGIKAGDQVWIEFKRVGAMLRKHESVKRLTRTQIVLDDDSGYSHFYRKSGIAVGMDCDRITGVATEAEIADFNVQAAAQKSKDRILNAELAQLEKLLPQGGAELSRHGEVYTLNLQKLRGTSVRLLLATLRAARSNMPGTI